MSDNDIEKLYPKYCFYLKHIYTNLSEPDSPKISMPFGVTKTPAAPESAIPYRSLATSSIIWPLRLKALQTHTEKFHLLISVNMRYYLQALK